MGQVSNTSSFHKVIKQSQYEHQMSGQLLATQRKPIHLRAEVNCMASSHSTELSPGHIVKELHCDNPTLNTKVPLTQPAMFEGILLLFDRLSLYVL